MNKIPYPPKFHQINIATFLHFSQLAPIFKFVVIRDNAAGFLICHAGDDGNLDHDTKNTLGSILVRSRL